jgi:hypothetical protein
VKCIDSSLCVYADTMEWLLAFKRYLSNQYADVTSFASLVSVTDSWTNHLMDELQSEPSTLLPLILSYLFSSLSVICSSYLPSSPLTMSLCTPVSFLSLILSFRLQGSPFFSFLFLCVYTPFLISFLCLFESESYITRSVGQSVLE